MSGTAGHADLAGSQELQEVAAAVVAVHLSDDRSCSDSRAANGVVVPWCSYSLVRRVGFADL